MLHKKGEKVFFLKVKKKKETGESIEIDGQKMAEGIKDLEW